MKRGLIALLLGIILVFSISPVLAADPDLTGGTQTIPTGGQCSTGCIQSCGVAGKFTAWNPLKCDPLSPPADGKLHRVCNYPTFPSCDKCTDVFPCVKNKDGSMNNPDGSVSNADGSTKNNDGSVTPPEGSVKNPDGSVTYPDGTVHFADGSVKNIDGSITPPKGSTINSDGTINYPDGTKHSADGKLISGGTGGTGSGDSKDIGGGSGTLTAFQNFKQSIGDRALEVVHMIGSAIENMTNGIVGLFKGIAEKLGIGHPKNIPSGELSVDYLDYIGKGEISKGADGYQGWKIILVNPSGQSAPSSSDSSDCSSSPDWPDCCCPKKDPKDLHDACASFDDLPICGMDVTPGGPECSLAGDKELYPVCSGQYVNDKNDPRLLCSYGCFYNSAPSSGNGWGVVGGIEMEIHKDGRVAIRCPTSQSKYGVKPAGSDVTCSGEATYQGDWPPAAGAQITDGVISYKITYTGGATGTPVVKYSWTAEALGMTTAYTECSTTGDAAKACDLAAKGQRQGKYDPTKGWPKPAGEDQNKDTEKEGQGKVGDPCTDAKNCSSGVCTSNKCVEKTSGTTGTTGTGTGTTPAASTSPPSIKDAIREGLGLQEPSHCSNKILDGDETGVDCGGSCSVKCGICQRCKKDADCATGHCGKAMGLKREGCIGFIGLCYSPVIKSVTWGSGTWKGVTMTLESQGFNFGGDLSPLSPSFDSVPMYMGPMYGSPDKLPPPNKIVASAGSGSGSPKDISAKVDTSDDSLKAGVQRIFNPDGSPAVEVSFQADEDAQGEKTATVTFSGTDENGETSEIGTVEMSMDVSPASENPEKPASSASTFGKVAGISAIILGILSALGFLVKKYLKDSATQLTPEPII